VVCEETGNIVLVDVGAATAPTAEGDMWAAPQVCNFLINAITPCVRMNTADTSMCALAEYA
jgi:hypothetical protein